jgi:hypothetical protein
MTEAEVREVAAIKIILGAIMRLPPERREELIRQAKDLASPDEPAA